MLIKDFGFSMKDVDDVKSIVTRTSLWMLSLTYFILFMHMLFDFLAFKNDIGFWHKREAPSNEAATNLNYLELS